MARLTRSQVLVLTLVTGLAYIVRSAFPIGVLGNAGHDDFLFVTLATELSRGHWLGPYNDRTLAKGMFYPLFIAIAHALGISLAVAEYAAYVFCCLFALVVIRRFSGSTWLAVIVAAALILNPVFYNAELARVVRENIYTPLSLAVLLSWAEMFTSSSLSAWGKTRVGVVSGCLLAAYWLIREEGVWLAPALLVLTATLAFDAYNSPAC